MWGERYWSRRYWASRYWPKGSTPAPVLIVVTHRLKSKLNRTERSDIAVARSESQSSELVRTLTFDLDLFY